MNRAVLPLLVVCLLVVAAGCGGGDDPVMEGGDDGVMDGGDGEGGGEATDDYAVEDQPDDAAIFVASPDAGTTVESPVEIEFEVEGVELTAAGEPAIGEGHAHVLVDQGCPAPGDTLPGPSDDAEADGIFHLGDGSSTIELDLEPGDHDLCAQLGDGAHRAFGATDELQLTVE